MAGEWFHQVSSLVCTAILRIHPLPNPTHLLAQGKKRQTHMHPTYTHGKHHCISLSLKRMVLIIKFSPFSPIKIKELTPDTYVRNSGDCRSYFYHHSPKTYDSALAGSNSTRSNALVRRWNTRPSSEKTLFLRCVAQGADHEVSAGWIAASSGDIKTPDLATSRPSLLLSCLSWQTSASRIV